MRGKETRQKKDKIRKKQEKNKKNKKIFSLLCFEKLNPAY